MKRTLILTLLMAMCASATVPSQYEPEYFAANGSVTTFTFTFRIFDPTTDMDVYNRTDSTGAADLLTLDSEYTLSATNNNFSSGGTITTVATYPSGQTIIAVRSTLLTQEAVFRQNKALENTLDRLTLQVQELERKWRLAITIPVTDPETSSILTNYIERKGNFLAFSSDTGDPIVTSGTIPSGSFIITPYIETLLDDSSAAVARATLGTESLDEDDMASSDDTKWPTQQSVDVFVKTGTMTMTNKTLTSPVLNVSVSGTAFLDDDSFATATATTFGSTESIKAYIDAQVATVGPAWSTWTPIITQGVGVTFTQTIAKYVQIGKVTIVTCNLAVTSAGTGGQVITISNLPVTILGSPRSLGSGTVTNTGTASYSADVQVTTGTTVVFIGFNQGQAVGAAPNFALANGDVISFMIMYETS